jgi:hypothetical protein
MLAFASAPLLAAACSNDQSPTGPADEGIAIDHYEMLTSSRAFVPVDGLGDCALARRSPGVPVLCW